MRFAYIDSQGNEVSIPGVDALALRIELGAIKAGTQLYDASADRWGPAESHEIFQTLARRASGDEGFLAPPPPAPASGPGLRTGPDAEDDAAAPEARPPDGPADDDAEDGGDTPGAVPMSFDLPEAAAAPPHTVSLDDLPAFDLVPEAPAGAPPRIDPGDEAGRSDALGADPGAAPRPDPSPEADLPDEHDDVLLPDDRDEADVGLVDHGVLEPLDDDDAFPSGSPGGAGGASDGAGAGADDDAGAGSFDFGGWGTLELEGSPGTAGEDDDDGEGDVDLGGGMLLEEPLADAADFSTLDMGDDDDLALESPLSAFDPDEPPAWIEQDRPAATSSAEEGSMDFSPAFIDDDEATASGDEAAPFDRPERRERPAPRDRPSPPRRPRRRSVGGPILAVLLVAAVGAGGWFALDAFRGAAAPGAPGTGVGRGPVSLPELPDELVPVWRDVADRAMAATVAEMAALRGPLDIAAEPNGEWLAGVYLANASRFPDVAEYWEDIGAFVDRVRADDARIFHDEVEDALDAAGVTAADRALLLERADSGFLATRPDRVEAYTRMDDLVGAALGLHRFLLANEGDIDFTPAAGGVSRDPVLEAVPATPALGDEMWDMVDRITDALDALGTLDRVTTERLSAVLVDRVRQAGVE